MTSIRCFQSCNPSELSSYIYFIFILSLKGKNRFDCYFLKNNSLID